MKEAKDGEINLVKSENQFYPCSVCGKQHWLFAMSYSIQDDFKYIEPEELGNWEIGKDYRICYPCFMKRMGFK